MKSLVALFSRHLVDDAEVLSLIGLYKTEKEAQEAKVIVESMAPSPEPFPNDDLRVIPLYVDPVALGVWLLMNSGDPK